MPPSGDSALLLTSLLEILTLFTLEKMERFRLEQFHTSSVGAKVKWLMILTWYNRTKDLSRVNEALNEDLSRLDAWLVSNKLSLNVAKTKSMLVSTKAKRKTLNKSNQNLQVNINGTELEVVSKMKLLGVLLDNSLDWKEQVQAVSLKVSRGFGILKHAKKFLPFSALTSLYTSIVEPHFRYCCSVWGCAGTTEINRLQKLQNRAARL